MGEKRMRDPGSMRDDFCMTLCVMRARSNEMTRNDLCWCGSGKKYKKCHMDFDERIRSMKFDIYRGQVRPPHSIIKNAADIEGIRKSGVVNDGTLDLMGEMVQPGIDTRRSTRRRTTISPITAAFPRA
mgnify:CR=1 FL=1